MSTNERLREIIEPIVVDLGLELFDLEFSGSTLVVTIDRAPQAGERGGIDVGAITSVTRAVSHQLDELDPIAGAYSLEVTSPGLERTLRTPLHYQRAVGQKVSVKTRAGVEGDRRVKGVLQRAGDKDIDILLDEPLGELRTIAYDDIEKTRTIFKWTAEPKPGQAAKDAVAKKARAASKGTTKNPKNQTSPKSAKTTKAEKKVTAS